MAKSFGQLVIEVKNRLRKVQRADDKTKKRYLIFISGLAMFFILGLWFFYLSFSLPGLNPNNEKENSPSGDSFLKTLGRGFTNIGAGFKEEIKSFGNSLKEGFVFFSSQIEKTRDFSLEGEPQDFIFKGAGVVPSTTLP